MGSPDPREGDGSMGRLVAATADSFPAFLREQLADLERRLLSEYGQNRQCIEPKTLPPSGEDEGGTTEPAGHPTASTAVAAECPGVTARGKPGSAAPHDQPRPHASPEVSMSNKVDNPCKKLTPVGMPQVLTPIDVDLFRGMQASFSSEVSMKQLSPAAPSEAPGAFPLTPLSAVVPSEVPLTISSMTPSVTPSEAPMPNQVPSTTASPDKQLQARQVPIPNEVPTPAPREVPDAAPPREITIQVPIRKTEDDSLGAGSASLMLTESSPKFSIPSMVKSAAKRVRSKEPAWQSVMAAAATNSKAGEDSNVDGPARETLFSRNLQNLHGSGLKQLSVAMRGVKQIKRGQTRQRGQGADVLVTQPIEPHRMWDVAEKDEVAAKIRMYEVKEKGSRDETRTSFAKMRSASSRSSRTTSTGFINRGEDPLHVAESHERGQLISTNTANAIRLARAVRERNCLSMDPNSRFRITWDIIGVSFLLYDIILIPLQVFDMKVTGTTVALLVASCVYWGADIPGSFLVGYHRGGVLEMDMRKIAWRYVRTWFLLDVVLVGVDIAMLSVDYTESPTGIARATRTIRLLRSFRILRLMKLPATLKKLQENIQSEYASAGLGIIRLTASIIMTCHFVACAWYGLSKLDDDLNWIIGAGMENASNNYKYATAMHWSLTQITPASMEIVPYNTVERAFSIVVITCGMVMFSSFISSITNAMTHIRHMNEDNNKQMARLQQYFYRNNISMGLSVRVRRHLDYMLSKQQKILQEKDIPLLQLLSEPLQVELHYEVFSPLIRAHPVFQVYNEEFPLSMYRICHKSVQQITLTHSDILFSRGDKSEGMYFVMNGKLTYDPGQPAFDNKDLRHGDWLSEVALWAPWVHHGTVKAQSECTLVLLDAAKFQDAVKHNSISATCLAHYAWIFIDYINTASANELTDLACPSFNIPIAAEIAWVSLDGGSAGDLQTAGDMQMLQ